MQDDKSQVSENEFPMGEEEEEGGMPFEESPESRAPVDSSLLSPDANTTAGGKRKSLAIDGLDLDLSAATREEEEAEEEQDATPKRKPVKGPRRRKRRRIEIDNDATELSSDHIKQMLRDTSDIVQQNRVHPADYVETDKNENLPSYLIPRRERMKNRASAMRIASLPYERLLARPNCADGGGVAPKLLQLWERNSSRLRGKPLPFRMRGEAGEEQRRQRAEEQMKSTAAKEAEDEEMEDIEIGRRDESMVGSEGRLSMDVGEQDKTFEYEGAEFPQHEEEEEEDVAMPFDEEDEHLAQQEQDEAIGFADDMPGMASPSLSEDSQKSGFSLGAVNDLEAELSDEPRQEQGDDLVSSDTKWHKHTVKVLSMLQRGMASIEEDGDKELSYDKLSYGTSRRTACGVFFELLQLKTWDVIELGQEASYGDIKITAGVRFNEEVPTSE